MNAPPPPPPDDINALPAGTRFGELEILSLLGSGGFGLVYLAQDHALDRRVAIKEYMPVSLAQRGSNSLVSVRSGSMRETFELGLRSFVNEARLLARFDHRSLLKVYRFWEANNTAYMVVPYLQGQTLKQWREAREGPPDGAWLMQRLLPLLGALEVLHAERVYHRDIAPDNVFLPADGGDPILLDFGAARRAISDTTQSFTAILKPSYAPLEQYDGASSLRQGPWTDLYALGAVVYHLLTGRPPPAATRRALADDVAPLSTEGFPNVDAALLKAVNWALALRPADRPQSVAEWREALQGRCEPPAPRASEALPAWPVSADLLEVEAETSAPTRPDPRGAPRTDTQPLVHAAMRQASGAGDAPPSAAAAPAAATELSTPPAPPARIAVRARSAAALAQDPAPQANGPARPPWVLLGLLLAAGLLGAFWWILHEGGQSGPTAAPAAAVPGAAAAGASAAEPAPALSAGENFVEPLAPAVAVPAGTASAAALTMAAGALPPPVPAASKASAALPRAQRSEARTRPAAPDAKASAPAAPAAAEGSSVPGSESRQAASEAGSSASTAARAAAEDPRAACGDRNFLSMLVCVDRMCRKPAFEQHAECRRLAEIREQRERNRD